MTIADLQSQLLEAELAFNYFEVEQTPVQPNAEQGVRFSRLVPICNPATLRDFIAIGWGVVGCD